jgi:hypothetical protein
MKVAHEKSQSQNEINDRALGTFARPEPAKK